MTQKEYVWSSTEKKDAEFLKNSLPYLSLYYYHWLNHMISHDMVFKLSDMSPKHW
jgi:hypothetical protein